MPLQIEVPLALKDQLFAEYAECGQIQPVADKHGLSWSLVKRLHDHEEWDKRLAAIRNEYAMAAAAVAAKAAKQMVSIQVASAAKLYEGATRLDRDIAAAARPVYGPPAKEGGPPVLLVAAASISDRAKAEDAATRKYNASTDIAELVLDRIMPTSDGKPGVAVQVNVDNRRVEIMVEDIAKPERQAEVIDILREVGALEPTDPAP